MDMSKFGKGIDWGKINELLADMLKRKPEGYLEKPLVRGLIDTIPSGESEIEGVTLNQRGLHSTISDSKVEGFTLCGVPNREVYWGNWINVTKDRLPELCPTCQLLARRFL